ncbi:MAG TPA: hypothetical protein VGA78_13950 [Gemmatimonadales bacterium]
MRGRSGHSLVEVLVAGLVLLAGVVPVAAGLGYSIRLGTRGRARAEAALAALARLDQLRAAAAGSSPRCASLASGSESFPDRLESWTIGTDGDTRIVSVIVTVPLPGGPVSDTAMVRLRCT